MSSSPKAGLVTCAELLVKRRGIIVATCELPGVVLRPTLTLDCYFLREVMSEMIPPVASRAKKIPPITTITRGIGKGE